MRGRTPVILVVDDDADVVLGLRSLLEDWGYAVADAANGLRALEYLRASPSPVVIILDLSMPVMDGFAFRKHQLQDPSIADIPVIVHSTMVDHPGVDALRAAAVVEKGTGGAGIGAVVARVVGEA